MRIILIIASNLMRELMRKKDIYVLFMLMLILMIFLSQASFMGVSKFSRYAKELGLGMVFMFSLFICVPFTAKLMIQEINDKTVYPLLAKPVSRFQVILGKYLGALGVSAGSFSLFYLVFLLVEILSLEAAAPALYFQVYLFAVLLFLVLCAMTLWFSLWLTFSAAVTFSFAVYFIMSWFGAHLGNVVSGYSGIYQVLYYLLPHFEFFDLRSRLVHLWDPLPLWVIAAVSVYAFCYTGIFIALAFMTFRKKWL